jgi:hypothetical protein
MVLQSKGVVQAHGSITEHDCMIISQEYNLGRFRTHPPEYGLQSRTERMQRKGGAVYKQNLTLVWWQEQKAMSIWCTGEGLTTVTDFEALHAWLKRWRKG